jgi:hypothetical protein
VLRRTGILSFVVFQFIWLNMVVPGHTRGIVMLPGYSSGGASCPECDANPACQTGASIPRQPAKNRSANCAICFFAARITPPPVVDLAPPPLTLLLYVRNAPLPEAATSAECILTCYGRAPPLV